MIERLKGTVLVDGRKIATGVGIGSATLLVLTAILTTMVTRDLIDADNVKYGIVGILLLSGAIGSWKTKGKGRGSLVNALGVGLCILVMLLVVTAMVFGGEYRAVIVTAGVVLTGCCVPLLLGKNNRKVGKVHRSKIRRR